MKLIHGLQSLVAINTYIIKLLNLPKTTNEVARNRRQHFSAFPYDIVIQLKDNLREV